MRDGIEGKIEDLLLDDRDWSVRHMVVRSGRPLHRRRVLLPPALVRPFDQKGKTFEIDLLEEELLACPDVTDDPPVSRQKHIDLVTRDRSTGTRIPVKLLGGDAALRSADQLKGYDIYREGARVGRLSGFVFETDDWSTCYLIVDVGALLFSRDVLLPVDEVERVQWQDGLLEVDPEVERIDDLPRFKSADRIEDQPRE
jgi:hypothetical protein